MGCVQTKPVDSYPQPSQSQASKSKRQAEVLPASLLAHLPTTGPLSANDYQSRLLTTGGTQTVHLPSGYTIRYAYVSQRGYYPETPSKANQDAVIAYKNFANDPDLLFLGIFDGHGSNGTQCAQFAKEKVSPLLLP